MCSIQFSNFHLKSKGDGESLEDDLLREFPLNGSIYYENTAEFFICKPHLLKLRNLMM